MQKKVAFITIHVGANFGSVLQTIATSEALKLLGYEPLCINYVPPRVANRKSKTERVSLLRQIFRRLWGLYIYPKKWLESKAYGGYLQKFCDLSYPIYAEDSFKDKCPKADVYLTGSDQVWNVKHNQGIDTHYFFDGVDGKKVSFASSIGNTEISTEEKVAFMKYLSGYSSISVRENTALELLSSLGLKATQLLDPIFLLDDKQWMQYMSEKNSIKEPYLLIYTPYNTVDKGVIYQYARKIANIENLKVVTFSWTYYKDQDADITVRFASPGDFLNLMMNAEFIITNSFHGTAFSINLKKRFWVFLPSGFTTRITSVLKRFGLESRLIEDDAPTDWNYKQPINVDYIDKILSEERARSIDYLKKAID